MDLKNKKVLLLGYSLTARKSAPYFIKRGANVYISEYNSEPNDKKELNELLALGLKVEFNGHSDEFIKDADLCIISPSIKDSSPVLSKIKCPIYSDIEFVGCSLNYHDRMVLVTGTNGKTTTTMLTSHVLSKKFNAPYTGNVGVPPLYVLKDETPDYLVVEASSYQLHYSKNLKCKISILCNITPDHISWHNGMEGYIKDKTDILKRANKDSYVVLNYDDPYTKTFKDDIKANIFYFSLNKINEKNVCYLHHNSIYFGEEKIIDTNEINMAGNHNYQNVMCAIIASKILNMDNDTVKNAIKEFKSPSHRLEFITKINNTSYYNDSKATNPEASNVAINSFPNKKVNLIAGGRDKNTPLDEFVGYIKNRINKVVLIGEAKERFKIALNNVGFNNVVYKDTLNDAIDEASNDGPDIVLFSPACASFDMFENFEVRGEKFREYVLQKRIAE